MPLSVEKLPPMCGITEKRYPGLMVTTLISWLHGPPLPDKAFVDHDKDLSI